MSIIYDALKKVDQSDINNQPSKPAPKEKKIKPKFYLLYILMICLGLLVANLIFSFFSNPSKAILPAPALPPINATTTPQVTALTAQEESPPALVLNGIFFSENKGYALINNQILKEGDTIEGATVVKINANAVDLKFKDFALKLTCQK